MDSDRARDASGLTDETRSPSPTRSIGSLDVDALFDALNASNADAQPAGSLPAQPAGGLHAPTTTSSPAQTAADPQAHSAATQLAQQLAQHSSTYRDWSRRRRTGKHYTRPGRGTKRPADQQPHHPVAKRALALFDNQFGAQSINPFFGGAPGSAFAPLAGTPTPTSATPASTPTTAPTAVATNVTLDAKQYQLHLRQVTRVKKTQDRNRYLERRHGHLTQLIEEARKENQELASKLDLAREEHRNHVEDLKADIQILEEQIDKDQQALEQKGYEVSVLTHQLREEYLRRGILGDSPTHIPAVSTAPPGPGTPDPFPLF